MEYTKPGKGGLAHDKTESAYVEAMRKANFPLHYTAFNSITGRDRAIYLMPFNSFEEVQNARKILTAPTAAADLERINAADGELLDEDQIRIFNSVPELSYHSKAPSPQNHHFLQAHIVQVRPGHEKEFEDLVKLYMTVCDKAGTGWHWAAYQTAYGESVDDYVFFTSYNSEAEIDQNWSDDPKFSAAASDDDKKKFGELRAASIESDRYELYSVNPAQSYIIDGSAKAESEFWKPKLTAPAANPLTASARQ